MDDDDVSKLEFGDTEFVDIEGCFAVVTEGIIGIMRPVVDDGVDCGITPSVVLAGLEYGEL